MVERDGADVESRAQCLRPFVDPSSSSIVYATFQGVFRRTDDGGASFVDVTPPGVGTTSCDGSACNVMIEDVLFDETSPSHLFVHLTRLGYERYFSGTYQESSNRGGSWTAVAGDFEGRKLYLDPRDANVRYMGGVGGVRKSRDSGASWFDVSTGLDLYSICDLRIARQRSDIIYVAVCSKPPTMNDASTEPHGIYWTTTGGE